MLQEKLINIGARVVKRSSHVMFQRAEVAFPQQRLAEFLDLNTELRAAQPILAWRGLAHDERGRWWGPVRPDPRESSLVGWFCPSEPPEATRAKRDLP